MKNSDVVLTFWNEFLAATGRGKSLKYFDCFYFDITEKSANELLALVLNGTKKATASSLDFFECAGMPPPKVGDFNIITDWDGVPHCVVETTAVTVLPFKDITFDICKREGEDDTLESWQKGHINFFTKDGEQAGYKFTWDMPVVFEDFEVVYTAQGTA